MKRKIEVESLTVRCPPNMKRYLEEKAAQNQTSANAEVVRCVRERMAAEQAKGGDWHHRAMSRHP
jgi:predicted HicB family RNase H-like nuclease